MGYKLLPHQVRGSRRFVEEGSVGLFWDMGVGKTLCALDAIASYPWRQRTLIVSPRRCCTRVWPNEARDHGLPLSVVPIVGTAKERERAASTPADVHVVNPENLVWLYNRCKKKKAIPYDALIIDESHLFKTPGSSRFRSLKQLVKHIPNRMILTGTPIPQNYHDLWSQIWILDGGKALGRTAEEFRSRYCLQDRYYKWHARAECLEEIDAAIAHLIDRVDARDALTMPECRFNRVTVELPPDVLKAYRAGLAEVQAEIEDGFDSEGGAFMRLRTLCSGFGYERDEFGGLIETKWLHREKIAAITEICEGIGGKNLLVAFNFRAEREDIVRQFGCPFIDGTTPPRMSDILIDEWCAGKLPMLAIHPASVGTGVNLQHGGHHLAWVSLPTNLAEWLQTNARIYRQGQRDGVTIHSVVAADTVDVRLSYLLNEKGMTQAKFLAAMKDALYVGR